MLIGCGSIVLAVGMCFVSWFVWVFYFNGIGYFANMPEAIDVETYLRQQLPIADTTQSDVEQFMHQHLKYGEYCEYVKAATYSCTVNSFVAIVPYNWGN
ncbi:MAG: hypothetical protein AAFU54_14195 [Chloroflexota bacterium]